MKEFSRSVYDLPLELLLRISEYLSFADLWYLGTCSRPCQKMAQELIWHKYNIDLEQQRSNSSFNHLIHSGIAFICRHCCEDDDDEINYRCILQSVANRLAVEIYDRTPQQNWAPCLDFFLDKTLGIVLDHVFMDTTMEPLPNPDDSDDISTMLSSTTSSSSSSKKCNYVTTRKGRLLTDLLVTLYPTLTVVFDADPAASILHRLLLAHVGRRLDRLARVYHQQHRRQLQRHNYNNNQQSAKLLKQPTLALRQGFRILVQFIGTLAQTDLMTPRDLHTLTRQRIITFFLSSTEPPTETLDTLQRSSSSSSNSNSSGSDNNADKTTTTTTTTTLSAWEYYKWRLWIEEVEFQLTIFLDLLRAIVCRQYTRSDCSNELCSFATLLNDTVSTFMTTRSSFLSR